MKADIEIIVHTTINTKDENDPIKNEVFPKRSIVHPYEA